MTLDPKIEAALALHRFGLGPREGSIASIASDPRGALLAELDRPGAGRIERPDLLSSVAASRAAYEFRAERQARQTVAKREAERKRAMEGQGTENGMEPAAGATPAAAPEGPSFEQVIFLKEVNARIGAAVGAELGFVERLVWFWSNHFCVSASTVPNMCGGYEREVIRPNVLGRFADMLLAAESHPAMLVYLDNASSTGPSSVAGINRSKGLNENLAREILELHTLGVRGGYGQEDVTSFAKVLTGWTTLSIVSDPEHGAEFIFNRRMHEPGPQTVVGKTHAESGVEQGRAVLADLARHDATADHVAEKLVRHFVSDRPKATLVERLAKCFRDTDGDLKQLATVLVGAPEAWAEPRAKLKRPGEWILAALRATGGAPQDIRPVAQAHNLLGEPLWRPAAPKGFSDDSEAWMDGLARRLEIANGLAGRAAAQVDPQAVLDTALGPLASAETRQMVARAESRSQALALLIMAPEFQRR